MVEEDFTRFSCSSAATSSAPIITARLKKSLESSKRYSERESKGRAYFCMSSTRKITRGGQQKKKERKKEKKSNLALRLDSRNWARDFTVQLVNTIDNSRPSLLNPNYNNHKRFAIYASNSFLIAPTSTTAAINISGSQWRCNLQQCIINRFFFSFVGGMLTK